MIHLSGVFAVSSLYGSRAMHLGIFINQFFRFGTPVFMMISGFVLFYNYRNFKEFDFKRFYAKKFKFILIPYLLWSAFYYIIPRYKILLNLGNVNLIEFVKIIVLGNAYPHLYFIFLIFQFYLLYPLFLKYFIKPMEKKPLSFYAICLIAQSIILIYEFSFKAYSKYGILNFFNNYYWKSAFGWFYYFLTGGLIALHYKKITVFIENNIYKIIPIYLLSAVLYIGEIYLSIWKEGGRELYERYGSIRPMTMVYSTISMFILIWIGRKIHKNTNICKQIIRICGVYSLGIYFLHPFVLEFIKVKIISMFPSYLGYSRISTLLFLMIVGWSFTVAFVLLLSKLKLRMFIIGKVPKYESMFIKNNKYKNIDDTY